MKFKKCSLWLTTLIVLFFNINTCLSFSNDSLLQDIKLRIYYNEKPDSLFINDQLYDIELSGEIIKIEQKSDNFIHAVKKGFQPVHQNLINLKKYIYNNVRLIFIAKENYLEDFTYSQRSQLSTIKYFGKEQILNPNTKVPILFTNSIILSSSSLVLLSNIDYDKKIKNPLKYSIIGQNVAWLLKQWLFFDSQEGLYNPPASNNSSWFISFNYSGFNLKTLGFSDEEIVQVLHNNYFNVPIFKKFRLLISDSESFSIGIEKHFANDFFVSSNITYAPNLRLNLNYEETTSYGPLSDYNINKEVKKDILLLTADANYAFLRIFNQEWILNLGVYWFKEIDASEAITLEGNYDGIYNFSSHTTKIHFKLGSFGFTPGLKFHTPITNKFSFSLDYKYLIHVGFKSNVSDKANIQTIQTGIRYNL